MCSAMTLPGSALKPIHASTSSTSSSAATTIKQPLRLERSELDSFGMILRRVKAAHVPPD